MATGRALANRRTMNFIFMHVMNLQTFKTRALILALFLAIISLPGCSPSDEGASQAGKDNAQEAEELKEPYYHGLIKEYTSLLAQDPNNLAATIALGNAYFDSGEWNEAVTYYTRALQVDPKNANVRTDMGTSFRNMGMHKRALAEYRHALKHDPSHQNARYNMGIIYAYDIKDYHAAIRVWEHLLKFSPNHPRADQMRSCIITFKKVTRKAEQ